MVHIAPKHLAHALALLSFLSSANATRNSDLVRVLGPQGVNLWKLRAETTKASKFNLEGTENAQSVLFKTDFRPRWYWVNDRHYNASVGGPVIVIDGGETSGEDRLPFLDTGIAEILAKATGGVGVVLEHRYYGASIPVDNFTTDSLRWLDNEQSAADSANFMANVKFDGIEEDLTAPNTPWIYYGGSYAGARAAHMRILYPELVYGAIASSAVTHAALSNWEYMEVIRLAADPKCSSHLENSIKTIDQILDHRIFVGRLKALFGLKDLEHDEDFVALLESPLGSWQSKVWDPTVGDKTFDKFCEALNGHANVAIAELPFNHTSRMVTVAEGFRVDFAIVNYAKWIKQHIVSECPSDKTVEQAFPPGKHFTVPSLPNVTAVNALGDFDLAADRLAFIDGAVDPWRPDTPHSDYAKDREDTILRPFKLIPGAVHHWDEYGLENILEEPHEILKIHGEMIGFVQDWLKDWKAPSKV
ncbi:hypothetical protein H0H81_010847 [Sphagnurus paluster]|uniref:Peptidase S28 n=1 Tax=Sphagnurus paluster TaxID=117069 RepID=A0A9P7KMG0_9AGAR|nr:hypothetical protein H0H81_010847 [Sphagnurus paluster]